MFLAIFTIKSNTTTSAPSSSQSKECVGGMENVGVSTLPSTATVVTAATAIMRAGTELT